MTFLLISLAFSATPVSIQHQQTIKLNDGTVCSVAFSRDSTVVAGCGDRFVQMFDVQTGERLHRLEGHAKPVLSVAFTPDGQLLASSSADGIVRLWNVKTGKPVEPPKSAAEAVEEIFGLVPPVRAEQRSRDRSRNDLAAQLTFSYASRHTDHQLFLQTARRLLCLKANHDVHNVKFPVFIFENYAHASPQWRPHLLAASAHFLQGTQIEDSPAIQQAREELKG